MAPPDIDPRLAGEGAGFVPPGTPPVAQPVPPAPAAATDGGSFAPPPMPSEQDPEQPA